MKTSRLLRRIALATVAAFAVMPVASAAALTSSGAAAVDVAGTCNPTVPCPCIDGGTFLHICPLEQIAISINH